MREATSEEEAVINGLINDWIEEDPQGGVYNAEYISLQRSEPGYLHASVDIAGCPGSDLEFFSRGATLRSASLRPSGENSSVYNDALVIEISLPDGRFVLIEGTLDSPPHNDEGHDGHFFGSLRLVDAAHAEAARIEVLQEHDRMIAGETVSDLRALLTRLEGVDMTMLNTRHGELMELTDELNRLVAKAA